MQLAIFTHIEHTERKRLYYSYSPYVREMNLWLKHVEEVEVVGTRRRGDEGTMGLGDEETGSKVGFESGGLAENGISYEHRKLTFTEVPAFNFLNFLDAVKAISKIPFIFLKIFGVMRRADHLHLRCPGNVGLLACICQIFFPLKPKSAKYAGNWDPMAKQPWTYRLQKWILSNTFLTRNMQVLVYGEWPGQSKNIVPFFTASFSEEGKTEVREKSFSEPFIFLFVGNLVEGKRPLEAVKLVEAINAGVVKGADQEIRASLEIFGDGPERKKIETYVIENQLDQFIKLNGNRFLEELKEVYKKAHFVILPSRSEGWPKAIAEGMFFGCVPIATPVSCVPWMLGSGSRGILLTKEANSQQLIANGSNEWSVVSGSWSEDVKRIKELIEDPQEMQRMSKEAKEWSQQYTLERFEEAIKEILFNPIPERTVTRGILSPAPFRGRGKTGKE